jgi:hypothetical protein
MKFEVLLAAFIEQIFRFPGAANLCYNLPA